PIRAGATRIGDLLFVAVVVGRLRLVCPRWCSLSADTADGADGRFGPRAHADHSRPRSAFAREGNLDPQRPEERLCPPQSAGERSRRLWPTGASFPILVTGKIGCA